MNRKILIISLVALALIFIGLRYNSSKDKDIASTTTLTKVAIKDTGVIQNERPLVVSFSEDMVSDAEVGQDISLKDMPFQISPEVAGTGKWISPSTITFVPDNGFPHGKTFYLLLDENLKSKNGKPARYYFSFQTQVNNVRDIWVNEYDAKTRVARILIEFAQPVRPANLSQRLTASATDSKKEVLFEIHNIEKNDPRTTHSLLLKDVGADIGKVTLTVLADSTTNTQSVGITTDFSVNFVFGDAAETTGTVVVEENTRNQRAVSETQLQAPNIYSDQQGNLIANLYFTHGIAPHNQEEFIKVTPEIPYTIQYSGMNFSEGLQPQERVTVVLLPGFMDGNGAVLDQEVATSFVVPNRSATLFFNDTGNYLTPVHGGRLAMSFCNLSEVQVNLYRHYDNNLPQLSLDDYYEQGSSRAREVFSKRFPVSFNLNEIVTKSIDLAALAEGKAGVYTLEVVGYLASGNRNSDIYASTMAVATKTVVLSDLGLNARVFPAGATVFLAGIASGKPVADAQISIFSASNQLIAEGRTDANGLFEHQRETAWDWQLTPSVVVAKKDKDISFLPLEYSLGLDLVENGSREYLNDSYEAFVFTPRGIFRPGETVDIKAFVRDKAHLPPTSFPVVLTITSARGVELFRQSTTLSEHGGAEMRFVLPVSAPMGNYLANISIPGQENSPLGSTSFLVENFVPPRLEVAMTVEEKTFTPNAENHVDVQADYIFGTPGANLAFQLGYIATSRAFEPKGFEGYTFGSNRLSLSTESNMAYYTGELDEAGSGQVSFTAPESWNSTQTKIELRLVGAVQEDSGRWVNQVEQAYYFPKEFMLGIKAVPEAKEEENFAAGKPIAVSVVAVDPTEAQITPETVYAEVFLVERKWNTLLRNGRYIYDFSERPVPLESFTLDGTSPQRDFTFIPKKLGTYRIKCTTNNGDIVATYNFNVWGNEGHMSSDGLGRLDQVEITLDKESYKVGERAKATVKSPFTGTLFFGLEHNKQISTQVINLSSPTTVVEVPVTAEISPSATVTAWVVRPVEKDAKSWFPHRAYGSATIRMDKAPYKLEVKAFPPDKVEPSKPVAIPFEVKDAAGNPVQGEFAVAFIDEGVLSLTNFATPNPLDFFFAQRFMTGRSYDIYSILLRPVQGIASLLKAGGGGMGAYFGGLTTQPVYLMSFEPTVLTDAQGKGQAVFDIPEYSGKGRLMIVGGADNFFASADSAVPVGRDLVVEASAPAVVAPGDTFDIYIKAFNLIKDLGGKVSITASTTGLLQIEGKKEHSFDLQSKGSQSITLKTTALQGNEVSTINLDVKVKGREDLSFTKSFEVVVRSPYPRSSEVLSAFVEDGKTAILAPQYRWDQKLSSISLSVGQNPAISALPALKFLQDYQHSCLEQTVSKHFPYISLTPIMHELGMGVQNVEDYDKIKLAQGVRTISNMQNPDGGFSMWGQGNSSVPWLSINATFFLLEVKDRVNVPKGVLRDALAYTRSLLFLDERFFDSATMANSTKAYAAFVLTRAGDAPLSWLQVLSDRQGDMLASGRIFLAAAKSLHAGNPKALLALSAEDLTIDWKAIRYGDTFESDLRNKSLLLLAWALVDPSHAKAKSLSLEVANLLNTSDFLTTQEAGFASLALGRFLEKAPQPSEGILLVVANAKGLTDKIIANEGKLAEWQENNLIHEDKLQTREPSLIRGESLSIAEDGTAPSIALSAKGGDLFASYVLRGQSLDAPEPVANGLTLARDWYNAAGEKLDTNQVTLNKGDRITVEITVRPEYLLEHLIIVDMLPGGMEVENGYAGLSSTGESKNTSYDEYRRSPEFFNEAREDRVVVVMHNIEQNYVYKYTMRAISTGTFALPATAAEGMYEPSNQAITNSGQLTIR